MIVQGDGNIGADERTPSGSRAKTDGNRHGGACRRSNEAPIALGPGPTPPYYAPKPRMIGETAVQFGVFDHLDDSGLPLARHFENRLRLIEAYDRAGFYAYHLAEHHNTPLGYAPSPSVSLAAVAQRTKHLKFGPMVDLLPLYHPLRLIDEVCMLDQISEGRFLYGVGRGISPVKVGFTCRFRDRRGAVPRGIRGHPHRPDRGRATSRQVLRFRPRADPDEADAEALSRAVVRHVAA